MIARRVAVRTTAALLPIAVAASALAGDTVKLKLTSGSTVTAVSGYSGGYKELGSDDDYLTMHAIEWWEADDDPCKLTAYNHNINTFEGNTPTFDICPGSPGNRKIVRLAGNSDNLYKVQVCTTDKNQSGKDKLKGVRIWSRSIDTRDPLKLASQSSAQEVKHTNCAKWHSAVECPAGQVASKIRVHYNSSNDFTGLALVCRGIAVK